MLTEPVPTFALYVDGEAITARPGQTLAAALLAAGRLTLRYSPQGHPRGIFCGMGSCFDCLVEVDDDPSVRSCVTQVREGMKIRTPKPIKGGADL